MNNINFAELHLQQQREFAATRDFIISMYVSYSLSFWIDNILFGPGYVPEIEPPKVGNPPVDGSGSKFLDTPATKNATLNIGAGTKPIEGAYNIDIEPKDSGVHVGDATNLSNIPTGSQSKIIMENPHGYDPLNPEIIRVSQKGGTIEITGSNANPYFNKIPAKIGELGLEMLGKTDVPNVGQFTNSSGVPLLRPDNFIKYILQLQ